MERVAFDQWQEILKRHHMRVTPQRLAVLEAVQTLSHPDADEVYQYVVRLQPALSLATVYNTIDKLVQEGIVAVVYVDGRRHYDLRTDSHYHLQCMRCRKLEDIIPKQDPVREVLPPAWHIYRKTVSWIGLCPECQKETAAGEKP